MTHATFKTYRYNFGVPSLMFKNILIEICSVCKNGVVCSYFIYRQNEASEEHAHHDMDHKNREGEGEGEDESIFETNWDESVEKFDDLNLKEEVLRGVFGYGFERPSPIQQKAILPILQGRDTIAQVRLNLLCKG